jgi:hypothetical protein
MGTDYFAYKITEFYRSRQTGAEANLLWVSEIRSNSETGIKPIDQSKNPSIANLKSCLTCVSQAGINPHFSSRTNNSQTSTSSSSAI